MTELTLHDDIAAQLHRLAERDHCTVDDILAGYLAGRDLHGIAIYQNHRVVYANRRILDIMGYDAAFDYRSLDVQALWAHVHPDDREDIFARMQQRLQGSDFPHHLQMRLLCADGRTVWVELSVSLMAYQGQTALHVNVIDVTAEVEARQALRQREADYRMLAELSPDIIVRVDVEGRYLYANEAHSRISELDPAEVVGRTIEEIGFGDSLLSELTTAHQHVIESGDPANLDFTFEERHYNMHVVPEVDSDGQIVSVLAVVRDITRLKSTVQELDRYRQIVETSQELIIMLDRDYRYVMVNGAYERYHQRSRDTIVGRTVADLLGEVYFVEQVKPWMDRALTGEFISFDVAFTYPLLGRRDIKVSYSPIVERDGRISGLVIVMSDVTERVRLTTELAQRERDFRALVENNADSITRVDQSGRYLYVNPATSDILKMTVGELLGRRLDETDMSPDVAATIMQVRQVMFETGEEQSIEFAHLGREFHARMFPERDETGQVISVLTVSRDVTALKRTQNELRGSELRFRTAFEYAPIGMALVSTESTFIQVNEALCRMLGYKRHELIGMRYQSITVPEDLPISRKNVERLEAGEIEVGSIEKRYTHSDGHEVWVALNVSLVRDEVGEPRYYIAQVLDISERKAAEQRALEAAIERERMRVLTTFIADASHEFRTPLSVIHTKLYLLEHGHGDPAVHRDGIAEQAENILQLVEALALMSRLDAIERMHEQPADPNTCVQAALTAVEADMTDKGILITLALDGSLPVVRCDNELLVQALIQVMDNAARYTPAGGSVRIATGPHPTGMQVLVQDDGPGIDSGDIPRIFQRFFRADKARTTHGFGLGLAIAQRIVVLHGGQIEVESVPGEGSTFRVVLPVS